MKYVLFKGLFGVSRVFTSVVAPNLTYTRLQRTLLNVSVLSLVCFADLAEGADLSPSEAVNNDPNMPPQVTEVLIQGAPFTQPLQEVPQSTSVISSSIIENKGSISIQDSMESIPGLSWAGGTSRPRFFLIRGIGEREQYEGAPNPSVATIIDGLDYSGLGVVMPLFDTEQVEVLRGPQGTRFGSSALAGALNVRSKDPTPYTTGSVQLMSGNDDFRSGAFAIGGAVPGTDSKLQLRASAFSSQSDGFRDNVFLNRDDTNKRDESFARVKIRYDVSPSFTLDATALLARNNNGYDAFDIRNTLTTKSDRPGRDDLASEGGVVQGTLRLYDGVVLTDTLTAMRTHQGYAYDGDWGNNPFWAPFAPYDYFSDTDRTRRTYSNELRLASDDTLYEHGESYRFVSGVFLQRLTENTVTFEYADDLPYDFLASNYRANTGALFGQVETPLGARTALSLGTRIERRSTAYNDTRNEMFSPSYSMLGGNASVTHDIASNVRVYVTASRGFKGGGFNSGPSVPQERRQYDPEYLWNFESGLKGTWLNKRLTTNLAVFHELRRNQQLQVSIQDDPSDPLSFTYITESAAEGRSSGVELESSFRAKPNLELFANGSVMNTEYTRAPLGAGDLNGRAFAHAPEWQFSTGIQWSIIEGIFTRVEVTGRDKFFFNDSEREQSKPYSLLNATVGWRNEGWKILAWGRNLGNERYPVRGFYFGNEPPDFPNKQYIQIGDPRAFGITVGYDF